MRRTGRLMAAGYVGVITATIVIVLAEHARAADRGFHLPPLQSLQATRDRPLFYPTRRPPRMPVRPPPPPLIVESVSLPFELTGIARGDGTDIAIVHNKSTDKEARVQVGQRIEDWKLESVSHHYVILRGDGERVRLWLYDHAKIPGISVRKVNGAGELAPTVSSDDVDRNVVPAAAMRSE